MKELLSLKEIIAVTQGYCPNYAERTVRWADLSTDSRTLNTANAFVALVGETFDGHAFIGDALAKGVQIVIADEKRYPKANVGGTPVVFVKDTLKALGNLARHRRKSFDGEVVAISGSTGKTTSKELVRAVLEEVMPVHATEGNFNNLIGLPFSIFSAPTGAKALVLELGTNHKGEIPRLMGIAHPTVSLLTTIGQSHVGMFASHEQLVLEKMSLLFSLHKRDTAIINLDNPYILSHTALINSKAITFSTRQRNQLPADLNIEERRLLPNGDMAIRVLMGKEQVEFTFPYRGQGFLYNIAGVLAVAHYFNLPKEAIQKGLNKKLSLPMRMETRKLASGLHVLLDCYNASPESMKNALHAFSDLKHGKMGLAILGDMNELGEASEELHYEVGRALSNISIEACVTVGAKALRIFEGAKDSAYKGFLRHYGSKAELATDLSKLAKSYDWVLLKASRGVALEDLLGQLE